MLINLATRIFNTPLLIMPDKAEIILGAIGDRIGLAGPFDARDNLDPLMSGFAGTRAEGKPYRVEKNVAIIPVMGTLVNRGAWVGASSGLTSYEGLTKQLTDARKDSGVRAILLDMDTPGGEAGGCFDVAALIREIREEKPVLVCVNNMACSAGYAIASAASQIWTTQTGILGSIGVVIVHMDHAGALEKAGIKPTLIHAGANKVDGHPFGPLPKAVRERFQAEVERLHEMFIDTVSAGRKGLKSKALKETEAGVFMGKSAVDLGLADGVATFERVLDASQSLFSNNPPTPPGYGSKPKSESPMTTSTITAEAHQTAITAAEANGQAAGVKAERARIKAILSAPAAEGRTKLAVHLATGSDMSPEAAIASLETVSVAAAAPASPVTAAQQFYAAVPQPGVPAGGDGSAPRRTSLADRQRATLAASTNRQA